MTVNTILTLGILVSIVTACVLNGNYFTAIGLSFIGVKLL